jgi:hypothetical protein
LRATTDGKAGLVVLVEIAPEPAVVAKLGVIPERSLRGRRFPGRQARIAPVKIDLGKVFDRVNERNSTLPGQCRSKGVWKFLPQVDITPFSSDPQPTGKSMLAKRLRVTLPPLRLGETLEPTKIHRIVVFTLPDKLVTQCCSPEASMEHGVNEEGWIIYFTFPPSVGGVRFAAIISRRMPQRMRRSGQSRRFSRRPATKAWMGRASRKGREDRDGKRKNIARRPGAAEKTWIGGSGEEFYKRQLVHVVTNRVCL